MALRLVLVDDHADFRAQARALLQAEGLAVVGEADDGAAAVDLIRTVRPDLVLLDVVLTGTDGFDVARRIAAQPEPPAVILISSRDAADFGQRLADAPVRGFLPKGDLSAAAIDAVLRVAGRTDDGGSVARVRRTAARSAPPVAPAIRRAVARVGDMAPRLLAIPISLVAGLAAVSSFASLEARYDPPSMAAGVLLVGWSTALAGLVAWWRRPDRRAGPLLVVAAWAWFLGAATWAAYGGVLQGYYVLLIVALVVTYPGGRLSSRAGRLVVGLIGLTLMASTVGRLVFVHFPYFLNCDLPDATCAPYGQVAPPSADRYGSDQMLGLYNQLDLAFQVALLLGAASSTAIVASRWWRAGGPGRRVLLPPLAMGVALTAAIALAVLRRQPGFDTALPDGFRAASVVALAGLPHTFTLDLVRGRLARTAVADLVVRVGEATSARVIGLAIGRALGDPSAAVLVWSAEAGAYVNDVGRPTELPVGDDRRSVTLLERGGQPVGALVHDSGLREDPALLASVSAVAASAIENERLQAEVHAQLAEVQASRARIVAAGDEQRAQLERDLHDGAQQQLVGLAIALRSARRRVDPQANPELARSLADASDRAESAMTELQELARGIHPAMLTEAGLGVALESLARRAPIPVTVRTRIAERVPPPIEAAAYFVVSEALANIAKHAHAHLAQVTAELDGGVLRVGVIDDGRGGAELQGGGGLRGLADRVAALGGQLSVESPRGRGTRILAEIPCGS